MKRTTPITASLLTALVLSASAAFGQHTFTSAVLQPSDHIYSASLAEEMGYDTQLTNFGGSAEGGAKGGKGGKGGGCGSECGCPTCCGGSMLSRTWASVEWMQMYTKGRALPPLVTSGGTGAIGSPGNTILFGGNPVGGNRQNGGRLTLGHWLDDCRDRGVQFRFFGAEGYATNFGAAAAAGPGVGLALPFLNTNPAVQGAPIEAAQLLAVGPLAGSVQIRNKNDILGGDFLASAKVDSGTCYDLHIVGGYQFSRVDDDLTILGFSGPAASTFDLFDARNEYHAATLGLSTEVYMGDVTFSALGKIGMGNMKQRMTIFGQRNLPAVTPGGTYALPFSNIGQFDRDIWVWSPEANLKLTYDMTEMISFSVGYTLIYWNRMALAGDHISRRINSGGFNGLIPAPPRDPFFTWQDTDFWVQSVDIGLSINY